MASAVDSRLAYARLSAVATASRLPTANRGSNNSYTTSWDTTRPGGMARRIPRTDFSKTIIDLDEIVTDGPTRDSIPPIHDPQFIAVADADTLGPLEPVISVAINGDARAYPLRILLWHEIVNDVVGGVPVLVSYCPLCNSGVVFDRRLGGELLVFGNTGRIRHYDMVMYDRNTESWWQQLLGEAVIGELSGKRLDMIPARLESVQRFRERAPGGKVLVPNDPTARPYGRTPYVNYEAGAPRAIEAAYRLPIGVRAMQRVVIVGACRSTLSSCCATWRSLVSSATILASIRSRASSPMSWNCTGNASKLRPR